MSSEIKFEKITNVRLPFDRRHTNDFKNYGIHGLDIWFILKGPKGATQYACTFDIYLPHVEKYDRPKWKAMEREKIRGFDVGYHSLTPQYEGQTQTDCTSLDGGKCYYDGSSLRANSWTETIFSTIGKPPEEVLWKMLEDEYMSRFEGVES